MFYPNNRTTYYVLVLMATYLYQFVPGWYFEIFDLLTLSSIVLSCFRQQCNTVAREECSDPVCQPVYWCKQCSGAQQPSYGGEASSNTDSYGSPQAAPVGSQDSYGSPQAAPLVGSPDSYGSPQAAPVGSQNSYGSPQAETVVGSQDSYGTPQAAPVAASNSYGSPEGQSAASPDSYGTPRANPLLNTLSSGAVAASAPVSNSYSQVSVQSPVPAAQAAPDSYGVSQAQPVGNPFTAQTTNPFVAEAAVPLSDTYGATEAPAITQTEAAAAAAPDSYGVSQAGPVTEAAAAAVSDRYGHWSYATSLSVINTYLKFLYIFPIFP